MNVLQFPGAHRAPSVSRAANVTRVSDVTPPSRARSVDKIADHLTAGMLSRCHHLETAGKPTATSEAKSSFEGQSLITSRNDRISVIARNLGQSVLKCKDKLALDAKFFSGHNVRMTESETEAQFKDAFTGRVKSARVASNLKQWQIAELLGIPQDKYKQYEGRSLLPHYLIGRFCTVCRVEPDWLITGKGPKPLRAPHLVGEEPERPVAKPKRSKRSRAA